MKAYCRAWKSNTLRTLGAFFGMLRATATARATVLSRVGLTALFKSSSAAGLCRNALTLQMPLCRVRTKYMYEPNASRWQYARVQLYDNDNGHSWGDRDTGVCLRDDRRFFFYTRIANSQLMQPW